MKIEIPEPEVRSHTGSKVSGYQCDRCDTHATSLWRWDRVRERDDS